MTRPVATGMPFGVVVVVAASLLSGCGNASSGSPGQMMGAGSGHQNADQKCAAPRSLSGQTVTVTLSDMGLSHMMSGTAPAGSQMKLLAAPVRVRPGPVTFVAANRGWRTHELVIVPLPDGETGRLRVGPDGKVSEAASLAEASKSCAGGAGDGIASGTVGWTTVTLAAGRYELMCNLVNHYTAGMHHELDVR